MEDYGTQFVLMIHCVQMLQQLYVDNWDILLQVRMVSCTLLDDILTGAQVYGLAAYGQGNGTVGFQNVSCTGNETNVSQCNYTYPSTCSHAMDAAVECLDLADSVCYQYLGVTGCCTGFPCYVASQGFCYCDSSCHFYGDCCAGIDLTCPGKTFKLFVQDHILLLQLVVVVLLPVAHAVIVN